MAQSMAPWVNDPRLQDWSKEDIWDMIVEEYPMMEQSPIFEAGYENWEPYNEKNLKKHKGHVPRLQKGLDLAYKTGRIPQPKTLDASAIDYLNTINVEPHVPTERLGSTVAHELPHLGMRLDSERKHIPPPFGYNLNFKKFIEGIEKEEKLAMMHDVMYAPKGYYGQANKGELMNMGYIEPWHSGHQYSDTGRELIRTSGLPQEFQRGLGYYEAPDKSQLDKQRQSTINWLDSQIKGGQPQRSSNRPTPHQDFNGGGIASLPGGQWTPSIGESDEEIYDIKPLQMDPGIMSIDDLEDLFEEVGLDKRLIYNLINTGGLSQLVA